MVVQPNGGEDVVLTGFCMCGGRMSGVRIVPGKDRVCVVGHRCWKWDIHEGGDGDKARASSSSLSKAAPLIGTFVFLPCTRG
jgi:hypothetical protein